MRRRGSRRDMSPESAGWPASIHVMTSPIGAPGAGGCRWASSTSVGVVVASNFGGVRRYRRDPLRPRRRVDCEHPATSTEAAISPAIRIPARLAGRHTIAVQARRRVLIRYRRIMHEHTVRATIASGTVEGFTRDGVNRWRVHSVRPPAGGPAAAARAAAGGAVAGCAVLPRVRLLRAAAAHVHDPRPGQVPADERGLPDAQRRRAQVAGRRSRCRSWSSSTAAATSWAVRRRRYTTARRWRATGLRVRLGELPPRRAGMPRPVVAVHRRTSPSTTTCTCGTW